MLKDIFTSFKSGVSIINKNSYIIYVYLIGIILTLFKVIIRYNIDHKEKSIVVLADGSFLVLSFFVLIGIVIECGTLNLIKSMLLSGDASIDDFLEGIKVFFWRILFGNILIGVLIVIIILPIAGLYIHFPLVGGALIFIFLTFTSIFLIMWNIILVYEERTITDSIWSSMEFGKENFIPMLLLNIIIFFFAGNQVSNQLVQSVHPDAHISNFALIYNIIDRFIPFNTLSIVLGIICILFFQLFFKIVLFIIYNRQKSNISIRV